VIEHDREQETERRIAAIDRESRALTGVYERGYLERIRNDWPT